LLSLIGNAANQLYPKGILCFEKKELSGGHASLLLVLRCFDTNHFHMNDQQIFINVHTLIVQGQRLVSMIYNPTIVFRHGGKYEK
jgi:hypothetical protein